MPLIELIAACAPLVHPQTMLHIVETESAGDPWAVNVNNGPRISESGQKAMELARRFIEAGYSVDVGLAQVNSHNFEHLDLSLEQAFDPCVNLKAGAQILRNNYYRAEGKRLTQDDALDEALSYYNTGDAKAGLENGYVARVRSADISQYDVPALDAEALKQSVRAEPAKTPRWDIFGDLSNKHGRWLKEGDGKRVK
jgi:type IV secretion system protein VirB1